MDLFFFVGIAILLVIISVVCFSRKPRIHSNQHSQKKRVMVIGNNLLFDIREDKIELNTKTISTTLTKVNQCEIFVAIEANDDSMVERMKAVFHEECPQLSNNLLFFSKGSSLSHFIRLLQISFVVSNSSTYLSYCSDYNAECIEETIDQFGSSF